MISNIEFTPLQKQIIRDICKTQIESLTRLYEKDSAVDVELVLAQYGADKIDFKLEVASTIKHFEAVINDPSILPGLGQLNISIFRHILSNVEGKYLEAWPNAVNNLWAKLFLLEKVSLGLDITMSAN